MDEGLLNDLLECSVCLERLDTSSRVLPCQHTFCLKCLKVIVESHKELRCPECRVLVETKIEDLPPNVLLMRILEGMRNSAPKKGINTGQRLSKSVHLQSQGQQLLRGENKQLPPHAKAIYDFISKESGDLSFKKGETVLLQKKLDSYWYQGECSGRIGIFPITYVQVIIPLPAPTALCKALYDFRMSTPDEEGCLAFDKGAVITVHRRVDENWAEGRLEQRVGIFPIAFVELNQAARQLMNSTPLNRPVPPLPDHARAGHSDSRLQTQHTHRYQPMTMSTPATGHGNYQNVATMSQSHPNYHATHQILAPQHQICVPQLNQHGITVSHGGLVTTTTVQRNIIEPAQTKNALELIQITNLHNKSHQTVGLQSVSRIGENYDRFRSKYEFTTPIHKMETYQNVRSEHFPVAVANFNANVSSDSSSSVNTPSVFSSTTTPNTSSNDSTCESGEPSIPSSPDNNTEKNTTVIQTQEEENQDSLNKSMGVLSLNESSTATNTSLNVSLPPADSPNTSLMPQNTPQNQELASTSETQRLEVPALSKPRSSSGPDSLLNFGIGLQAALSPSHVKESNYMTRTQKEHHREKRHSLTPASHLQGNHSTQNRHSAEIVATSLLDHIPEKELEKPERERRRRRSRSNERPLPAAYIALYPYKPQKPDELELKKGGIYTVTERCRDGWYKGSSERSQRSGVFPGNYVTPTTNIRTKQDKQTVSDTTAACVSGGVTSCGSMTSPGSTTTPNTANPVSPAAAPDAPPRALTPLVNAQPASLPWNPTQMQQTTPRSEKSKDKLRGDRSLSSGVSLMKRLAAMKKCKSPPAGGYSIDNPVFEDVPGTSVMLNVPAHHPVHVRSGSCPSQLLGARPRPPPPHARHAHRFLATGKNFEELSFDFHMGSSTISLVQETCEVIWDTLQPLEMKPPSSSQRWKEIAVNFYKRTKFPNCIGACDGKHIRLISPLHSGSLYFNYKKYNSIVLMAIVDADYCFTAINVGSYGKESDSSIFKNWTFAKKLRENRLNLPEDQPLPGIDTSPMPYVFVGDEAFPISNNFLRPYPRNNLTTKKRIFNYRLSSARRLVECAFGILSNKWRIFHTSMTIPPDFAGLVTKTACVLHNFVRRRDGYNFEDTLSHYFSDMPINSQFRSNRTGRDIRDYFAEYFVSPAGEVSFQYCERIIGNQNI